MPARAVCVTAKIGFHGDVAVAGRAVPKASRRAGVEVDRLMLPSLQAVPFAEY